MSFSAETATMQQAHKRQEILAVIISYTKRSVKDGVARLVRWYQVEKLQLDMESFKETDRQAKAQEPLVIPIIAKGQLFNHWLELKIKS